jgi:WD40 repeat protein
MLAHLQLQIHPFQGRNLKNDIYFDHSTTLRFKKQSLLNHSGCVNTVAWNDSGELVISGSDDCHINIWQPFQKKLVADIDTRHTGNIFCAKFMHKSNDTQCIYSRS